ncbi:MAG TPA: hypothetical protein VLJ17_19380 [Xanthobacteraceae bacterium]|nr:hypothetical protein [Xanthobacteraceae bacterium]
MAPKDKNSLPARFADETLAWERWHSVQPLFSCPNPTELREFCKRGGTKSPADGDDKQEFFHLPYLWVFTPFAAAS